MMNKWPHLKEPEVWEFYIKTRPEVEAENASLAADGRDVSFEDSPMAETAQKRYSKE